MQFRFHCLVVQHVSGRVTVTPVEHPELAVHAPSMEDATLDLTLAFDDRIGRAHPRHLSRYAGGAEGEAITVRADALRVWHGDGPALLSLRLPAWQRPALGGLVEVHVPGLRSRFWLPKAGDPLELLKPTLADLLQGLDDGERLDLMIVGGKPSFEELSVESAPLRLASLRPAELTLDARPFRTRQEQAELDAEDDPARRRQRARADERKRRERERRRTPTLKTLAVAMHTRSARARLEPAWEREADVARLLAHVARERPPPLVLVAPQGAGKSALLEALARELGEGAGGPGGQKGQAGQAGQGGQKGQAGQASQGSQKGQGGQGGPSQGSQAGQGSQGGPRRRVRPVFALDASRLIAGTGGFGEWQAQLQACLEEARRSEAVLLLGKLSDLLDAGRSAHSDSNAAQVLAPALAAREVTVLAEATPEDWAAVQRRNASFASVWTPWTLDELSPEATARVLARVAEGLAARAPLEVRPGVVEAVLGLCRRFWPYGALAGNAITFLRRLLAARAHERAPAVTPEDAIEFFSAEAGIPPALLRDDVALDPAEVRAALGARVMAQPRAVERAAQVVSTIKASLQDPRRPAAVLLFAGPTGVGKTELAKALAEFVFGRRERLVRVDMGEYLGPDALGRLLGEGGAPGLLPAVVRRQPFCVLLLDELEKAHPSVFDALLGVIGEGRLSDAAGRVTDFRNAVIVMTTNLGADTLRARVGFGPGEGDDHEAARRHYVAEAQRFFRPEFFNRLDDVIVFRPLGADAIGAIVGREIEALGRREGFLRRDLDLRVDDATRDALAREGLDPRLGARPLKRALERRLATPAAAWLAAHRQGGPTRLLVEPDPRGEGLRFRAEALGRDAEGSRARAEQVLDEAADLRALVGRWDRSAAARALRARLQLLEHGANSKGFWDDARLAEDLAREARRLRDLVEPLAEARRGAEAAEDLAVEAWYDRKGDSVEALAAELAALRARFAPLPRRVYLAREPVAKVGVLYLAAPRSAWSDLLALAHVYRRWAESRGATARFHVTEFIPPAERPKTKPDDPEHAWRWQARWPNESESPLPAAVALEVDGSADLTFLDLETGAHRFADGGDSVVRARFVRADPRAKVVLRPVKPLLEALKVGEIRRYSRGKQRARDLR
ncbi:MAG TPA: AAA family ATPase, partial [Polyangiaceae bacterium]|nr:AAA family ATPase [Polyangiaceae bacterium]